MKFKICSKVLASNWVEIKVIHFGAKKYINVKNVRSTEFRNVFCTSNKQFLLICNEIKIRCVTLWKVCLKCEIH